MAQAIVAQGYGSRAREPLILHVCMSFAPLIDMMEPTDWMDAAIGSTELFWLEPKWLRATYTFATEMMEPKDWMAAATSSELFRLEPKWLRVTYTFAIETMETTEWTEAAKESSVLFNRMNESEELWKLHFYVSRTSLHFWTTPPVRFWTFCPPVTLDVLVPISIQLVCRNLLMLMNTSCEKIATRTGHTAAGSPPSAVSTRRNCCPPRWKTTRPSTSATCLPSISTTRSTCTPLPLPSCSLLRTAVVGMKTSSRQRGSSCSLVRPPPAAICLAWEQASSALKPSDTRRTATRLLLRSTARIQAEF